MYLCQWSLDIKFGKQKQALNVIKAWGEEKMKSSGFAKAKNCRVYAGHVGESAAHIVDEYVFESLKDFEDALGGMSQSQFKSFAEELAKYIIDGSQKWTIHRIVV